MAKLIEGLYYSESHEYVKVDGKFGYIGITDYAQHALGNIVYVDMPEVDDDIDIVIEEKDIRIDVMRASGNGGQCVNTTDSAVRLTHYPTGIVVYSQTEKSQLQNKAKAFALLKAKLYDIEQQQRHDAEAELRRSQIGTGDRSEKIRTYNFPQGRVTDHRINLTLYKLDKVMNGDIQEIIDACIAADQAAKLSRMQNEG